MARRTGRKRKRGLRESNKAGSRIREKRPASPAEVAAAMPHRKGLGELAVDQRAESLLGRLALRDYITPEQLLAGQQFARLRQGYLGTIQPPQALLTHSARTSTCDGGRPCLQPRCRCEIIQTAYQGAFEALQKSGSLAAGAVAYVTLSTVPIDGTLGEGVSSMPQLRIGLSALARHFGLTSGRKSHRINASWQSASNP